MIRAPAVMPVLALVLGCVTDPVLEQRIAALGPEDPAVPIGPLHRPGQDCLVCHSERGTSAGAAKTIFSVAGTVYRDPTGRTDQEGAQPAILWPVRVSLSDSTPADIPGGFRIHTVETNCAGNFYLSPREFDPTYPMWVDVTFGNEGARESMVGPVHREGSCGFCHSDPAGAHSNGHVYSLPERFVDMAGEYEANGCPPGQGGN